MLYKVFKYSIVDEEIEKVILYYENISNTLGLRFEQQMEKALDQLETNAHHYFNLEDKRHRRIPIAGFPYAFIYVIDGDRVVVKMLFPQRDDPAKLWNQLSERQ
jgi:hypothetical protein